jgi:DNA mismatch repair protein MSH5
MYDLDTTIGDIHGLIQDLENSIILKLEIYITQNYEVIVSINEVLAELDCLISMSLCVIQYNLTRPTVTKKNVLKIENGRNLIQELFVNTFISNNTNIDTKGRINLITGPNNSGKSVYLKQVGIIVFLGKTNF